jgi:hypothetical protein
VLPLTLCQPEPPDLSTAHLVGCVANAPVTKQDQARAAAEVNSMKPDSVVANVIVPDWVRMRAANTACANH